MTFSRTAAVAAAWIFASSTYAQTAKSCTSSNVCYSLNFPDSTASSSSGPIYFQMTAPTTLSWVALGQGSSMSGANIFVMYTDSTGTNVTLSPRLGTGHVQPDYDSAAQVTLLAGSGVSNGIMTANVRCDNCNSWSGGSMDFSSSSTTWIHAQLTGSELNSDSTSADISQHDTMGTLTFQSSAAEGGSSLNPFESDSSGSSASSASSGGSASTASACVSTASSGSSGSSGSATSETATLASPTGSGCPTAWPSSYSTDWPTARPTQYASCFAAYASSGGHSWPTTAPYVKVKRSDDCSSPTGSSSSGSESSGQSSSSGSGSTSFNESDVPFGGNAKKASTVMIAHGVLAALAFVIFMPTGGIIIRLLSFPGLVWVHAVIQIIGYLLFIAAFGLGIYMATQIHELNQAHPIIGIVLFILLFFQPILGVLHHTLFKKYSRRVVWSYGHIWLGRIIITLGIINGGLGLKLAQNATHGQIVAYAVVGGLMWLAYMLAAVYGEIKRKRRSPPPAYRDTPMAMRDHGSDSDEGAPRREWFGGRNSSNLPRYS